MLTSENTGQVHESTDLSLMSREGVVAVCICNRTVNVVQRGTITEDECRCGRRMQGREEKLTNSHSINHNR
jgi:hypothetical protein